MQANQKLYLQGIYFHFIVKLNMQIATIVLLYSENHMILASAVQSQHGDDRAVN